MELVDVHAHLCASEFADDLPSVLEAARAAGVTRVLAVGEDLEDARRNLELAERFPQVRACAGLYPTILDEAVAEEMADFIRDHRDALVGIGEVGLDYWMVKADEAREVQRRILARFVALSNELDLPLNVHSRSAGRATIAVLREHGARRVLLHAFDGKASSAQAGLAAGYYFSIPPSVVRSEQKQKLVRALPLERLLVETDSPVLGPDRTERNEPKNVALACRAIADLKRLPVGEVARVTTANTRALFPRAFDPA